MSKPKRKTTQKDEFSSLVCNLFTWKETDYLLGNDGDTVQADTVSLTYAIDLMKNKGYTPIPF